MGRGKRENSVKWQANPTSVRKATQIHPVYLQSNQVSGESNQVQVALGYLVKQQGMHQARFGIDYN